MISWKAEKSQKLLLEVKNRGISQCTTKDLKWSIEHNRCFVNGYIERFTSTIIKKGDLISIDPLPLPRFKIEPARILFEDPSLFVYDKPPFLPSEELASLSHTQLAHRLDRDTTGVLILAKNRRAHTALEELFRKRKVGKEYLAIVKGITGDGGEISGNLAPIHRREGAVMWGLTKEGVWSKTLWKKLQTLANHTLLQCIPITGRTHQIRIHLASIGHPILGDYTYGSRKKSDYFRPLLHAQRLSFQHPLTGESLICEAPLPPDFTV